MLENNINVLEWYKRCGRVRGAAKYGYASPERDELWVCWKTAKGAGTVCCGRCAWVRSVANCGRASPERGEVWVVRSGARRTVAARAGKVRKRPSPRKSANREMVCMAVGRFFKTPIQNVFSENENGPTNPVPHTSACQERGGYMRGKKKKRNKKKKSPTHSRPLESARSNR